MPAPSLQLRCAARILDLTSPQVMGVLNVTPDSFSDGGRYRGLEAAVEHGLRLVSEGAALIDVGGESTRPGAEPVSVTEELERVVPVIRALSSAAVVLSVDTSKPEVMAAAAAAGAGLINDVRALRAPGALAAAR
jgi:dihydropteroate synthase